MARIAISNTVEPRWQQVIEERLQLMLGSLLGNVVRIDIDLKRVPRANDRLSTYTLSLLLTQHNGERYAVHNDQPDANMAIEGAIARARRALKRMSRTHPPLRKMSGHG